MLLLKLCLEVRKGAYFLQSDFHRMECMSALLNGMLNAQAAHCRLLIKIVGMDGWGCWLRRWMGWMAGGLGTAGRSSPTQEWVYVGDYSSGCHLPWS